MTVADAQHVGDRIKVTVSRDLTVAESKELRKLLRAAETNASCTRIHISGGCWGGFGSAMRF
ncbi:hypothetical protein [Leucobacter japonicus]|uniref:hypothetical protein n=1 Tax=Leucobacter japonicus TaxID=1461259 RepID=UPI0012E21787|nr:hypothetical protein [Leucobacter japonicus]